jgi:hypothetical protein
VFKKLTGLFRKPGYPSRAEFAEEALKKLSEDARIVNVRHSDTVGEALNFEFANGIGGTFTALLDDAWLECCDAEYSEEERDMFLTEWAAVIGDS